MMPGAPTPSGANVYRTSAREPEAPPRPPVRWRRLLAPLGWSVAYVLAAVVGVALFSALSSSFLSSELRIVPAVGWIEDAIAVLLPATLVLLVVLLARRARSVWGGLRLPGKIAYVFALLFAQSAVVVAGEAAMFLSRGGLHLFGPSYKTSAFSPDGRMAHIYTPGGFQCGYDVFVSGPMSLTARKELSLSRATCVEPPPRVRWNADGTVTLVDANDRPLESQSSPGFSLFGGGC